LQQTMQTICRERCLHRPACRALSNPPTSNSAARLNFHHHKKHMPAHSAPGICFFCYRTIGNTAQFPPCGLSTAPASALPKCSIMSGCGTRIVLRGQKPLALCDRCSCFGSLFPPLAALTFAASSIICAFGLASAAPRSPYRHLELCGIAYKLIPPAPSDNNTPPTNPRRPHSFSCPGSGHTRAENRYTPCCLPL